MTAKGDNAVAARRLGLVEGLIGGGQQPIGMVVAMRNHTRHADTYCDAWAGGGMGMIQTQLLDAGAEPFTDRQCAGHFGVRQQDDELLAAIARHEVARPPQQRLQRVGHTGQAAVAAGVTVMVVVILEKIDVDHQQRQRHGGPQRPAPFLIQQHIEVTAISNARQFIANR